MMCVLSPLSAIQRKNLQAWVNAATMINFSVIPLASERRNIKSIISRIKIRRAIALNVFWHQVVARYALHVTSKFPGSNYATDNLHIQSSPSFTTTIQWTQACYIQQPVYAAQYAEIQKQNSNCHVWWGVWHGEVIISIYSTVVLERFKGV